MESATAKVASILSKTQNITKELLDELTESYGVHFEILTLPRFSFPPAGDRFRLFRFSDKIFT